MITEKRFYAVPPQLFTANGTIQGQLKIADASIFKVGQIVLIQSSTQQPTELKIKRISDINTIFVGDVKLDISSRTNISAFLVADGAFIFANEQKRPDVPEEQVERLTYEEEPTVARRVVLVDKMGNKIDANNPLDVNASVTVTADVRLTAVDTIDRPHDSIRIGDGVEELAINPDGSINVNVSSGSNLTDILNEFNSVSSVTSGVLTDILTYTVPLGKNGFMYRLEFSGTNIATYEVYINNVIQARKRTWFSTIGLGDTFEFGMSDGSAYKLLAGDIIKLKVIHNRPSLGDFDGRLQLTLH